MIIQKNSQKCKNKFGLKIPVNYHSKIRSDEACYKSSSFAVNLAKKFKTRLHILHLSTSKELDLFKDIPFNRNKRITSEVCVHHLWFDSTDYKNKGTRIKWNPSIKSKKNKTALLKALLSDKIDTISTDHAPHTLEEKQKDYFEAPSGGPLIQHSLVAMLEFFHLGKISIERIVRKMCHTPAELFQINKRGFIRKGYWADIVLLDLNNDWIVNPDNILYKCKWSPFEGQKFKSKVTHTFINGNLVYEEGKFNTNIKGKRLEFSR